jgi:hypothetical protein
MYLLHRKNEGFGRGSEDYWWADLSDEDWGSCGDMVNRGSRRWLREVGWFGGEEFIGADLRAVPIIIFGRSGDLGGGYGRRTRKVDFGWGAGKRWGTRMMV